MDRPLRIAGVAAALAIALAALAASSGPVRLWVIAPSGDSGYTPAPDTTEPTATTQPAAQQDEQRRELPSWIGTAVEWLAVAVAAVVALLMATRFTPRLRPPRWRPHRAPRVSVEPLPEVGAIAVDLDAAHLALTGGDPSDAIIACWLQLEHDAAEAGLARLAHETSAEYVERVVARASVDRAPIGELAALYREARFSRHRLDDSHRQRAHAALERVGAALRHTSGVGQ